MAGSYAPLPSLLKSISSHYFGEAGVRIIGFVTMNIDVPIKLLRQREAIMHIFDAHITSPLIMWNTSYKITAELHSLTHQLASIREGHDTILWESYQLQVAYITHFFTHL